MIPRRFGFRVLKEEQDAGKYTDKFYYDKYPFWADEIRLIRFVEVEFSVPAYPDLAYCHLYYERNMAKTEIMPIEALKSLYPKSYKENEEHAGDIYLQEFGEIK